jgi:hypothetical protein
MRCKEGSIFERYPLLTHPVKIDATGRGYAVNAVKYGVLRFATPQEG